MNDNEIPLIQTHQLDGESLRLMTFSQTHIPGICLKKKKEEGVLFVKVKDETSW